MTVDPGNIAINSLSHDEDSAEDNGHWFWSAHETLWLLLKSCNGSKTLLFVLIAMSAQSTAIQPQKPSTTPSTHSTRKEHKWQMYLFVMSVLFLATIWIFIKSLIKHKAIASRLVTTRFFIVSFIESKACFIVLVAFSLSANSALSITAGGDHACALQTISSSFDGLKCYGLGMSGQLGSENTANIGDGPNEMGHFLPNIDTGIIIDDIMQVTAGVSHTCIWTNTGKVKCFGSGYIGKLGYGNTDNKGDAPNTMGSNLPFIDLGKVVQIAAGTSHTCALLNDGTTPNVMKCFGSNNYGQLGYEDTQSRGDEANEMGDNLPSIDLGTDFDPIQIIAAHFATCALSRTNKVKCYGHNLYGQLGLEDTEHRGDSVGEMGDNLLFVNLGNSFTPIQIAGGWYHFCALSDTGDVKCFGWNNYGQLGLGHTNNIGDDSNEMGDSLPIIQLGAGLTATQITTGYYHSCALFTIGNIKCWGYGGYGQLGNENTNNLGDTPGEMGDNLPFVNLGGVGYSGEVTEVDAGGTYTCATFSSDEVKCFGRNRFGQLGSGNTNNIGDTPNSMGDALPVVDLGFSTSNPTPRPSSNPTIDPTTRFPTTQPITKRPTVDGETLSPTLLPTAPPSRAPVTSDPTDSPVTTASPVTANPTSVSLTPTASPVDTCGVDKSLGRVDCDDDNGPSGQCSVLITVRFEVCYVEPYMNGRGTLWTNVKTCACSDVFAGSALDDGVTKDCYVVKYFYANQDPSGSYSEYPDALEFEDDCALQSVFKISVQLYHSDCDYVKEIAEWFLDQGDSLEYVLSECNLKGSKAQSYLYSDHGFGRIYNTSVVIKLRDQNGDSNEIETGSAVLYSIAPVILVVLSVMFWL